MSNLWWEALSQFGVGRGRVAIPVGSRARAEAIIGRISWLRVRRRPLRAKRRWSDPSPPQFGLTGIDWSVAQELRRKVRELRRDTDVAVGRWMESQDGTSDE